MSESKPSDRHGTNTRYGYGCRCKECREAHAEVSQEWKWNRTYGPDGPMGPHVREAILASLRRTGSVMATAANVGVTHQAIYRAAKAVPGFGDLIAKATTPHD